MEYNQQIIIASGILNIPRATLGFATALASLSAGVKLVVFLAMEGAIFADPNEGNSQYIQQYESIDYYIKELVKAGAIIEACSTCVENYCPTLIREGEYKKIRDGLIYAGLSTAAIRSLSTPTIVF